MTQLRVHLAPQLRDDPALRAEMATLGAMLLSPELIGKVGDLRPADFRSPIHSALATVILDAREDGLARRHPPPEPGQPAGNPEALATWTRGWLYDLVWERAQLHPAMKQVSPDYLLQLIAASPYPPRIGWYAQIVREQAARTRIAMLAIDHAGTLAETMAPGRLREALVHAQAQIHDAAQRLTPAAEVDRDPRRPPPQPDDSDPSQLVPRPPPAAEVTATEDKLLGGLLADNHLIDPVSRIVERRDFHGPGRGILYGLAEEMHRENMPVDAVTLAPAAEWHGALSNSRTGDGRLTLDQLFQLPRRADPGLVIDLAQQVQQTGIRLNVRYSLRHLVSTANHADVPARAVREEVASAVQNLTALRGRLASTEELYEHGTALAPALDR